MTAIPDFQPPPSFLPPGDQLPTGGSTDGKHIVLENALCRNGKWFHVILLKTDLNGNIIPVDPAQVFTLDMPRTVQRAAHALLRATGTLEPEQIGYSIASNGSPKDDQLFIRTGKQLVPVQDLLLQPGDGKLLETNLAQPINTALDVMRRVQLAVSPINTVLGSPEHLFQLQFTPPAPMPPSCPPSPAPQQASAPKQSSAANSSPTQTDAFEPVSSAPSPATDPSAQTDASAPIASPVPSAAAPLPVASSSSQADASPRSTTASAQIASPVPAAPFSPVAAPPPIQPVMRSFPKGEETGIFAELEKEKSLHFCYSDVRSPARNLDGKNALRNLVGNLEHMGEHEKAVKEWLKKIYQRAHDYYCRVIQDENHHLYQGRGDKSQSLKDYRKWLSAFVVMTNLDVAGAGDTTPLQNYLINNSD